MKNPNDLEIIRNILLRDSDDDEDIVLDESDTDGEEHVSERDTVIGRAKHLTNILVTCKCIITDRITESMVEETNKYVCSVETNHSSSREARNTDGAEIEAPLSLLYLAGDYLENRFNLEEL
ncbi:hypothetical protein NPIL_699431 [Nephila pilipes]|uniref:Uncharacterized protein n=1 Tax=Nephila pilipes TaxID=299642 RepID=A0A8X6P159_NEPPI|nr:hypothetical protein NPIL_38861 [Nephila pilipes]GFU38853.1 hypothetical protein NPIL_699431 [Nephila pilipes]